MRKIASLVSSLLIASVLGHGNKKEVQPKVADYLDIHYRTTFIANAQIFTWINGKLSSDDGYTTKILADSGRNKTLFKTRGYVPLTGATESNILYDYTLGHVTNSIPFLNVCQTNDFFAASDLKTMLENILSPHSERTTYLGEDKAPWDTTQTYWHFRHTDKFLNLTNVIETFWDTKSGELKWVHINDDIYVAQIKNGLEPATFTDDDFKIPGCIP